MANFIRDDEWLIRIIKENSLIRKNLSYNAKKPSMPFTKVYCNSHAYQAALEWVHEEGIFDCDDDAFSILCDGSNGVVMPVGATEDNRLKAGLKADPHYNREIVKEIVHFIRNFSGLSFNHKVRIPLESSNGWPNFEHGNDKYVAYLDSLHQYNIGSFHPRDRKDPIVVVGTRTHPPTFNLSKQQWKIRYGDSPDGRCSYSPELPNNRYYSKRYGIKVNKAQKRNRVVNGHSGNTYVVEKVAVTLLKNILKLPIFVSLEEERMNKLLRTTEFSDCFKTDIRQFDSTIPKIVIHDILMGLFGDTDLDIDSYLRAFSSKQIFKKNMQERDTYWSSTGNIYQGNSSGVEGTTIINCFASLIFCGLLPIFTTLDKNFENRDNLTVDEKLIIIKLLLQIPVKNIVLNILGDDFLALEIDESSSYYDRSGNFFDILRHSITNSKDKQDLVFAADIETPKKSGLIIEKNTSDNKFYARPSSSSFLINRLLPEKNADSIFRIGHAYPGLLVVPKIFQNSIGFEKNWFLLQGVIKRVLGIDIETYIQAHKQRYLNYINKEAIDEQDLLFLKYLQDPQRILWDEAMEELYERYSITTASMLPESQVEIAGKKIFKKADVRCFSNAATLKEFCEENGLANLTIDSTVINENKPWQCLTIFKFSIVKE